MRKNHSQDKALAQNKALPPIEVRTLRAFANGIAQLCCALRLIEFDIVCRLTPRERPEYATVETRFRRGSKVARAEDVIPVPTQSTEPTMASEQDDLES